MENYIQSKDPGDMYIRPKAVSLMNPKDEMKSITYFMESIVNLKDGSIIKSDMGATTGYFTETELSKTIKVYHPLTMEELGEKTVKEMEETINAYLFSYMVYLRNPEPVIPVDLPLPEVPVETPPDETTTS